MRGNWLDTTADITDEAQASKFPVPQNPHRLRSRSSIRLPGLTTTDAVVARIDRKLLSGKDVFFGQQTYAVTVAPGVDMALIAALCICLDEKNNEG